MREPPKRDWLDEIEALLPFVASVVFWAIFSYTLAQAGQPNAVWLWRDILGVSL